MEQLNYKSQKPNDDGIPVETEEDEISDETVSRKAINSNDIYFITWGELGLMRRTWNSLKNAFKW